jgi:hypothetical protein
MLDTRGHVFHLLTDPLYPSFVLDVILDFDTLDLRFEVESLVADKFA